MAEGSIYALVGANGAGKTTLIKILMNIFAPTCGDATVLGVDSRKVAGDVFNRIGYVSENQEMPDWMTGADMLAYWRHFYPTWDRDSGTVSSSASSTSPSTASSNTSPAACG